MKLFNLLPSTVFLIGLLTGSTQEYQVDERHCAARITDSELKGEMVLELANHTMEIPLRGSRGGEKKAEERSIKLEDLVGAWNLLLETEEEDLDPRLFIKESGGEYSAVFDAGELGRLPAKRLKLKGDKLTFVF